MIGKTISNYRVLEKLGQGGMGEVFLAQDKELGRKVALKFLPEKMEQDPAIQKRFIREARSAAAIDHPYVCKIYETGMIEGKTFIAMEYVEGQTLSKKLEPGPLPLKEALRIASEMAEALEEIHNNRFLHRDVKPSNIMLSKQGHIKVMDFGLARQFFTEEDLASSEETPTDLTPQNSIVGTVAYMAPEQVHRQKVGRQADIFSFGVTLYEMTTGIHPFKKSNIYETASAILHDHPPPLAQYRNSIPELLQHTVGKMLAKEPGQRYQSVHEVRTNLAQLLEGLDRKSAAPPSGPAVAVLPFVDMSPQKDQEEFCDGLAEELINALTSLKGLHVAARNSAFWFRGEKLNYQEIGRQLRVSTILEGSVQKEGERLRIKAKLVKVEDGYYLWSESYDRKLEHVFQIQDEISQAVVEKLKITLLGGEDQKLFPAPPKNLKVYELYLKGRFYWNKRTEAGLKQSVQHFRRAIEQDPDYALAHAGLAAAYATLSVYGVEAPRKLMDQAKSAAERAIDIDGELALAHASLGTVRSTYEWEWEAADSDFRRAIELEPENGNVHHWYATHYLTPLGRFDEANSEIELAREIDPLNLAISSSVGLPFYFERRYDRAIEEYLKTLKLDPSFGLARYFLGQAYAQKGMYREAIAELEQAVLVNRGSAETIAALGYVHAIAGQKEKALTLLKELIQLSGERYVSPVLIAQIHAGLKERDQAFDYLDKAYQSRSTDLIWLKVRPVFKSIRSDPRFDELSKKMGFPT